MSESSEYRGPWAIFSTMCFCGDMRVLQEDGLFAPHTNRRTGEPCPPPGNYMETEEAHAARRSIEVAAARLIREFYGLGPVPLPDGVVPPTADEGPEDQSRDGVGWCAPSP